MYTKIGQIFKFVQSFDAYVHHCFKPLIPEDQFEGPPPGFFGVPPPPPSSEDEYPTVAPTIPTVNPTVEPTFKPMMNIRILCNFYTKVIKVA